MPALDTWLGGGAVLATVERPTRPGSTGVVVCPPFGHEHVLAYRTERLLAARLADHGIASVRYDHPGSGDSVVAATATSHRDGARLAAEALRTAGCTRIVYVGLASGALVAAAAADDDPDAAGLVLWDPPRSGRSWLRAARALAAVSVAGIDTRPGSAVTTAHDGTVTVVGADIPADQAAAIGALGYPTGPADRMPVLVAVRNDGDRRVPAGYDRDGIDIVRVDGHEALLGVSSLSARIPAASVDAVGEWVTRRVPPEPVPAPMELVPTERAVVDQDVEEHLVRIGPDHLFAVDTRPRHGDDDAPTVVLLNGSSEHRIGVTRLQVDLARRLAAAGIRSVRVDRRGTGETGPVVADEPSLLFTQEWIDDVSHVLDHLALPADRVGIVGLSVGGWLGLQVAAGRAGFVVGLSQADYRSRPAAPGAVAAADAEARPHVRTRRDALVAAVKRHLPYRVALALARRGHVQFVEPVIRAPLAAGTDVTLVLGPGDGAVFRARGGATAAHRLAHLPGTLRVVELPEADHAMFGAATREAATEAVLATAVAAFVQDPSVRQAVGV
ncbi:alpha/beta fold hydrolase [Curtobacterium sp. MCBD17_035]|uniref:alpha/beta fold hydrolase n=1 Tax=Curtobacterium sp. MCBD17_035 TaxID=2175673 RepID=UPI000DA950A7|nr:alpha/beta fold hydrolase [Curtobacterium sp. MCBD17_035]WIB68697.1 alpha/beta fold hydrolase [Curtobacterium sp. MCBD17_035]